MSQLQITDSRIQVSNFGNILRRSDVARFKRWNKPLHLKGPLQRDRSNGIIHATLPSTNQSARLSDFASGDTGRLEPPQHEVQNEKPNSETLIIIRIKARAERLNRYLGVIYWSRQIYPRDYYVQKNCINERRINIEPWLSLRR